MPKIRTKWIENVNQTDILEVGFQDTRKQANRLRRLFSLFEIVFNGN